MENATRALLISAAVLVTIVLIAVGILLIRNVSDTSEQAQKVGNSIGIATNSAVSGAIGGLKATIISKEKFNSFLDDYQTKYKAGKLIDAIINEQNTKLSNQILIEGYIYQDKYSNLNKKEITPELKELLRNYDAKNQENNKALYNHINNIWRPKLLEDGKILKMNNPLDFDERDEKFKMVYENKMRQRTYS